MKSVFNNPFRKDGNWYKGNVHLHTTNSDGCLSPARMASEYKKTGYNFVVITDHFKRTDVEGLSDDKMLVIAGEEVSPVGITRLGCDYEFLAPGIKRQISLPKNKNPEMSPQTIIDRIRQEDGLAILAHPNFSHMMPEDILPLQDLFGVEIFNPVFGLGGRSYSLVHWDQLLESGKKMFGFAGDDSHGALPIPSYAGYIMVKAPSLTKEAVMESIRNGYFYASNGPAIIDVEVTENSVSIVASESKFINFVGDVSFPLGSFPARDGGFVKTATYKFTLKDTAKYLRMECTDAGGRSAWTNPIFFEK